MKAKRTMSRFFCDNPTVENGTFTQTYFADTGLAYRTDDDRDSGTESDDEGAEIEELQKYMETIIHLDSNRRRTKRLPLTQVTKPDLQHHRRRKPLDTDDVDLQNRRRTNKSSSDTDLHHMSDADFVKNSRRIKSNKSTPEDLQEVDFVKNSRRIKTNPDDLQDVDFIKNSRRILSNKSTPEDLQDVDFTKNSRRIKDDLSDVDFVKNGRRLKTDTERRSRKDVDLFYDADLQHHSSEEELEVINSHHHPEKRKWGGEEDRWPVEFIAEPPEDVYKPSWCSVRQAHIPMHELCAVSPRKRHRRTPVVAIQRPCLDFEKMQQINRVRLL